MKKAKTWNILRKKRKIKSKVISNINYAIVRKYKGGISPSKSVADISPAVYSLGEASFIKRTLTQKCQPPSVYANPAREKKMCHL